MKPTKKRQEDQQVSGDDGGEVAVNPQDRRIYICGGINEPRAANFIVAFQSLDSTPGTITVVLNSPGGTIEAGYAIYDAISLAKNMVVIEGIGKVYSMAALVFQAGDLRLLTPQTEVMIHNIYIETSENFTLTDAAKLARDLGKSNKRYQKLMSRATGRTEQEIKKMCGDETYLSAQKAVRLGFADGMMTYLKGRERMKKNVKPTAKTKSAKSVKSE